MLAIRKSRTFNCFGQCKEEEKTIAHRAKKMNVLWTFLNLTDTHKTMKIATVAIQQYNA